MSPFTPRRAPASSSLTPRRAPASSSYPCSRHRPVHGIVLPGFAPRPVRPAFRYAARAYAVAHISTLARFKPSPRSGARFRSTPFPDGIRAASGCNCGGITRLILYAANRSGARLGVDCSRRHLVSSSSCSPRPQRGRGWAYPRDRNDAVRAGQCRDASSSGHGTVGRRAMQAVYFLGNRKLDITDIPDPTSG